jgi:two-component system phosphate regulon sensor histidine kinase PhoR
MTLAMLITIGVYAFQYIEGEWYIILFDILRIVAIAFIATLIIFMIVTRKLVDPIKHLTRIATRVNVENMEIPIISAEENEIGELARQFRAMSTNLKQSFEEIHNQREILKSITNSIHQAIWMVDENTRIQMANINFEYLVGTADYKSKFLFDLMRNHDIINLFHDTVAEKSHINREIEHLGKIYLITSTYLKTSRNVVFTLLDISDLKSIEEFKKDLISNVSHELKTPLTTIKGFVETMLEDAEPTHSHYLKIVNRNTDRLITIINDLLSLSKLEQTTQVIKQDIVLKTFLEKIEKIFLEEWKKQNIKFVFEVEEPEVVFFADEFMLEQVFVNLIDNSIKYSGTDTIKVTAGLLKNKIFFFVSDDGIGIPQKHHKRIFERFYVVDKSRTKRIGGTGLGLAIVKHIINLHQGEISVESEEEKGTKFLIWIPTS